MLYYLKACYAGGSPVVDRKRASIRDGKRVVGAAVALAGIGNGLGRDVNSHDLAVGTSDTCGPVSSPAANIDGDASRQNVVSKLVPREVG